MTEREANLSPLEALTARVIGYFFAPSRYCFRRCDQLMMSHEGMSYLYVALGVVIALIMAVGYVAIIIWLLGWIL